MYRGDDLFGGGYVAGAFGYAGDYVAPASGTLAHGESLTASLDYAGGVNFDGAYDNDGNYYETDTGVFEGRATEGFVALGTGEKLNADLFNYGGFNTTYLPHYTLTRHFQGRMDGSMVYEYSPVPEPASCAALGLGTLALLRRRRA